MAPIESRPASGFAERYWAVWLIAVLVSFLPVPGAVPAAPASR